MSEIHLFGALRTFTEIGIQMSGGSSWYFFRYKANKSPGREDKYYTPFSMAKKLYELRMRNSFMLSVLEGACAGAAYYVGNEHLAAYLGTGAVLGLSMGLARAVLNKRNYSIY